jgi:hypothetical protein
VAGIIATLEAQSNALQGRLTAKQKSSPQFAAFEGQYGTYYGPLVTISSSRQMPNTAYSFQVGDAERPARCGPPVKLLEFSLMQDERRLTTKLELLKKDGVLALIVEIVQQRNGYALTSSDWENVYRSCKKAGIYLIVDEALTALRCGAPFAHQLPQYSDFRPSFVLFGKALAAAGIGICLDGLHVSRFEFPEDPWKLWDHYPSQVLDPFVMLRSWGIIKLAQTQNWTERAELIGETLRSILERLHPGIHSGGLAALIYVPTEASKTTDVAGAATPEAVRWMPYLDPGMTNIRYLQALFGPAGRSRRKEFQGGDVVKVCIICGEIISDIWEFCVTCSGSICDVCEGEPLQRHKDGLCLSIECS